ncbi:MAG: hypothetical protein V1652_01190 [bacterium]
MKKLSEIQQITNNFFRSIINKVREDSPERSTQRNVIALIIVIIGLFAFTKPTPFIYLWNLIRWDSTSALFMILVGIYFILRYKRR